MKFLSKMLPAMAAVILLCLGLPQAGFAAEVTVGIATGNMDKFFPATTNISVGDTVIWVWNSSGITKHSTTSGTVSGTGIGAMTNFTGLWGSGPFAAPHSFTNSTTFSSAGSFPYYCQVHFASGMTGAVFVSSGSLTPTVSITNPASGALFITPANVTIQATASESGGSVTNVQFRVGSNILTNEIAPPFSAVTNNLAAGNYTLTAIAADSLGVTATNSVTITVDTPPTVTITNPANGALLMPAPTNVIIQVSASDPDAGDGVTNVQFRVGTTVLTNDNTAPFAAITNNLAAGSYTLTAIASDNSGVKATNSVNVIVDTPPAVTITNPLNNATLSAPANLIIKASVGTVTNVQLLIGSFLGTTVLTNVTTSPYLATTNAVGTNSYTLSAVASDNLGVKNTNSISISIVTPVTVSLTNSAKLASTNFQFSYPANVGLSYVIQHSTNLVSTNWISIITNVASSNPVVFVDIHATNSLNFYRVGRMPNP